VKGLVCNLIKIKDLKYATALQVSAGNKLYNVVVDTERTGKQLLQNGQLQRKVTLIPLNKISARWINESIVKNAKSVVCLTIHCYWDKKMFESKFIFLESKFIFLIITTCFY